MFIDLLQQVEVNICSCLMDSRLAHGTYYYDAALWTCYHYWISGVGVMQTFEALTQHCVAMIEHHVA